MTLVKYNRLNDYLPATFGDMVEHFLNSPTVNERAFVPAVDILLHDGKYEIQVMAPGLKKEDFSIDVKDGTLTISGERKLEDENKNLYRKMESRFGKFERSFKLNEQIQADQITARYEDGILFLTLPVTEKKDTKKVIDIK